MALLVRCSEKVFKTLTNLLPCIILLLSITLPGNMMTARRKKERWLRGSSSCRCRLQRWSRDVATSHRGRKVGSSRRLHFQSVSPSWDRAIILYYSSLGRSFTENEKGQKAFFYSMKSALLMHDHSRADCRPSDQLGWSIGVYIVTQLDIGFVLVSISNRFRVVLLHRFVTSIYTRTRKIRITLCAVFANRLMIDCKVECQTVDFLQIKDWFKMNII